MHSNNTMFVCFLHQWFRPADKLMGSWGWCGKMSLKRYASVEYWNIADNFTHGNREGSYMSKSKSRENGELILTTSTVDKATGPDGKKYTTLLRVG